MGNVPSAALVNGRATALTVTWQQPDFEVATGARYSVEEYAVGGGSMPIYTGVALTAGQLGSVTGTGTAASPLTVQLATGIDLPSGR